MIDIDDDDDMSVCVNVGLNIKAYRAETSIRLVLQDSPTTRIYSCSNMVGLHIHNCSK